VAKSGAYAVNVPDFWKTAKLPPGARVGVMGTSFGTSVRSRYSSVPSGLVKLPRDRFAVLVAPGAPPRTASRLMPSRPGPPYVMEYPPRTVVLPSPKYGTCQENPTAGPKLFRSEGKTVFCGLGESGPTNSSVVSFLESQL